MIAKLPEIRLRLETRVGQPWSQKPDSRSGMSKANLVEGQGSSETRPLRKV